MKDSRFTLSLAFLFCFGLFWIAFLLIRNLTFPDSSFAFLGRSNHIEFTPGQLITQVFTAKQDHLRQINVLIGRPSLKSNERILFQLFEENCSTILREQTIAPWSLQPYIYHHFTFREISSSRNQRYCLGITYQSDIKRPDRPYLLSSEGASFLSESFIDTGKGRIYEGRTLQFRPSYGKGSWYADWAELGRRLTLYKPPFFTPSILMALSLVLLSSTLFLIRIIFSLDSSETKKEA